MRFVDRVLTPVALSLSFLAGCASPPPKPTGAVVPLQGGLYQWSHRGFNEGQTMKVFTRDAEITCAKPTTGTAMPWSAKPPPPKYVVTAQSVKNKDGKEIKSDNKMLDAGIAVGLRHLGLEGQDAVDASITFKCE